MIESKRQIFPATYAVLTDSTRFVVLPSSHPPSISSSSQSSISSQSSLSSQSSSEGSVTLVPNTKMSDAVRQKERAILRLGKNRLDTFTRYKYPDTGVPFATLADAGFFCRSERPADHPDQVECIFCQVKISNWSRDMDPIEQHIKFSERCEFVMGYHVGNIPVSGKTSSDPIRGCNRSRHREPDICGSGPSSQSSSSSSSPTPESGHNEVYGSCQLRHQVPAYPRYVTTESRIRTYPSNWDTICPIPAERLADAGLFYNGPVHDPDHGSVHDAVTCFHCKRVIFNWEAGDDPWSEHQRLVDVAGIQCYFLRLNSDRSPATATASAGASGTSSATSSSPCEEHEPKAAAFAEMGRKLGDLASSFEQRAASAETISGKCKVCYEKDIEILFLPCRHATVCAACAASVDRCPYCRADIESSIRIYLS